ncbi:MAG: hypothetical protein JWO05_50 [Gemmatimonadetes bacterium]|nr:hypothetical protein [Gemmatimonadota bacterium]
MKLNRLILTAAAVAAIAPSAFAQGTVRDVVLGRSTPTQRDTRGTTRTSNGGVYDSRNNANVPPGQMPPNGMCRVWIDGVPAGQQPRAESCQQAERDRVRYGSNARVIYGNSNSNGRVNGQQYPSNGQQYPNGQARRRDDNDDDDRNVQGRRNDSYSKGNGQYKGKKDKDWKKDNKNKQDKHDDRDDR